MLNIPPICATKQGPFKRINVNITNGNHKRVLFLRYGKWYQKTFTRSSFSLVFSSHDLTDQVSFSDQICPLSIVVVVNFSHFHLLL